MSFNELGFVLLFVKDPLRSLSFYSKVLEIEPVEQSPTFVLFAFKNIKVGLWSVKTAEPAVQILGGGCELAFDEANVDKIFEKWRSLGVSIVQPPTNMDFGRTFLALDPDGHRIRIFHPYEGTQ